SPPNTLAVWSPCGLRVVSEMRVTRLTSAGRASRLATPNDHNPRSQVLETSTSSLADLRKRELQRENAHVGGRGAVTPGRTNRPVHRNRLARLADGQRLASKAH